MSSEPTPYTPEMEAAAAARREEAERLKAEIAAFVEKHGTRAFGALRHGMNLLGIEPMVFLDVDDIREAVHIAMDPTAPVWEITDLRPSNSNYDELTWATQVAAVHNDWPNSEVWLPFLKKTNIDCMPALVWDTVRDMQKELLQEYLLSRFGPLKPGLTEENAP